MLSIIGMMFVGLIALGLIALYAEKWHRDRATDAMEQLRKARDFLRGKQ